MRKNFWIILIVFFTLVALVFFISKLDNDSKNFNSLSEKCINSGGIWIQKYSECESISEEDCLSLGGVFEFCGSACRHDSNEMICTLQCIDYCKFN